MLSTKKVQMYWVSSEEVTTTSVTGGEAFQQLNFLINQRLNPSVLIVTKLGFVTFLKAVVFLHRL